MINRKQTACGFTLTELLIAVGIFTFGAVAILALFSAGAAAHRTAVDRSVAALAAQNMVARYRYAFTDDVEPDKEWTMIMPEDLEEHLGYRYQVAFQPLQDSRNPSTGFFDAYVMRIDIFWGPESRPRYERFRTVMLRQMELDR